LPGPFSVSFQRAIFSGVGSHAAAPERDRQSGDEEEHSRVHGATTVPRASPTVKR
jgi:hypothetical protein